MDVRGDLFAASIPVIPFALVDIRTGRIVSLVVTGLLMALLGIARAAALAGVLIGRLVT